MRKQEITNETIRRTAFDEVALLSNEKLRNLLKEIKKISNLHAPRYAKQSSGMKRLFELQKSDYNNWSDQFSDVQRAIEIEVICRVVNEKL